MNEVKLRRARLVLMNSHGKLVLHPWYVNDFQSRMQLPYCREMCFSSVASRTYACQQLCAEFHQSKYIASE